ncbi:Uncharacterized protein Adt_13516 [Abeliophyllum distichum]|uniref:Uncharacterized protein n=1 Tax=Abeliophyllum distichum TaxID=126358 RepID=A0ABD1TX05_9LAMI
MNKYNEAQNTLADLENNMKVEIENLETDLYSIKKELELMERAQGLLELEKSKLEDELRRSQRECDTLKEKITSLSEDERVSSDREKRIEQRYSKVCDELQRSQKKCEELKEKVTRLVEDKKVSSDRENRTEEQYAKVCDELKRCQKERDELKEKTTRLLEDLTVSSDREKRTEERYAKFYDEYSNAENEKHKMILHLNEKIRKLGNQKLGSEQTAEMYKEKIKSLDSRVAKMNGEVEKLKREKSDAHQIVEELRCKILEADQTVDVYKKRFEDLNERFEKVEKGFATILNVDVNDLPNLANDIEKSAVAEEDAIKFPSSNAEKESSGNGNKWSGGNADFGNHDMENFRKERNLKNGADGGDTSPMVRSSCKSNESRINVLAERGQPVNIALDHGEPVTKHFAVAGSSGKMSRPLKSGVIIEISDSDDEATPEKFIQSPSFSQTNEKIRADYKRGSLVSSMPKRNRSTYGSDKDEDAQQKKRTREVNYDGPWVSHQ